LHATWPPLDIDVDLTGAGLYWPSNHWRLLAKLPLLPHCVLCCEMGFCVLPLSVSSSVPYHSSFSVSGYVSRIALTQGGLIVVSISYDIKEAVSYLLALEDSCYDGSRPCIIYWLGLEYKLQWLGVQFAKSRPASCRTAP